jgi:hypothetical protein
MAENSYSVANERLLRRSEAARYLSDTWRISHSVATLAKLAVAGSGPEFRKAGRTPLYRQDGLDAYAQSKISRRVRSTSELTMGASAQAKMAAA